MFMWEEKKNERMTQYIKIIIYCARTIDIKLQYMAQTTIQACLNKLHNVGSTSKNNKN